MTSLVQRIVFRFHLPISICMLVSLNLTMQRAYDTGLDSSNASRVVDILAGLAGAGVTVIITIHQPRPDILRLMDRMLLLSGNGQVSLLHHVTSVTL